jgi:hypothetical protein
VAFFLPAGVDADADQFAASVTDRPEVGAFADGRVVLDYEDSMSLLSRKSSWREHGFRGDVLNKHVHLCAELSTNPSLAKLRRGWK